MSGDHGEGDGAVSVSPDGQATVAARGGVAAPSFMRAMTSIVIADVSMSLDNVLAVAGVARDNTLTLVFGLGLSIVLMAVAATAIARTLESYRLGRLFGPRHHPLGRRPDDLGRLERSRPDLDVVSRCVTVG